MIKVHLASEDGQGTACGKGKSIAAKPAQVTCTTCRHYVGWDWRNDRPDPEAPAKRAREKLERASPDLADALGKCLRQLVQAAVGELDDLEAQSACDDARVALRKAGRLP